jgi:hypothetical protein
VEHEHRQVLPSKLHGGQLLKCVSLVTPAAAPSTDAHEDWIRIFLVLSLLDAAHLDYFNLVRATAHLELIGPGFASLCPMLVRQGQLLPFKPSAGVYGMS